MLIVRATLAVLLLAFYVGASSQGISDNKTVGQKNKGTEQPKAPAKVDTSSLEKAIRESIKEASEKPDAHSAEKLDIDRQIRDYTGQLSAFTEKLSDYTRWLVVATVILGVIGIGQGYLTWRSVRVAESALTDLERPYIFVDVSGAGFHEGVSRVMSGRLTLNITQTTYPIEYRFVNHGRTTALLTAIRQRLHFGVAAIPQPIDPLTDPGEPLPQGTAIQGNGDMKYPIDARAAMPDDDSIIKNVLSGRGGVFLYLIGFVRYRDIFGKGHITGFCAKFDQPRNCFILEGRDGYNYTGDEGEETPS